MLKLFGREGDHPEPPLTEEEKQTQESRKDYEKRAAERAKKIMENYRIVCPKRKYRELTQEEVIRFDAERENKARELASQDKKFENLLEFERDTDLIVKDKWLWAGGRWDCIEWLEGKIKGKKIEIKLYTWLDESRERLGFDHKKISPGIVDGQPITLELTQKILDKYLKMISAKNFELKQYFEKTHFISDPDEDKYLKERRTKEELEKRSDQIAKDIGFNA